MDHSVDISFISMREEGQIWSIDAVACNAFFRGKGSLAMTMTAASLEQQYQQRGRHHHNKKKQKEL